MNIQEYYGEYKEDQRLFKDNAHRVEFDTTINVLSNYINGKKKILDIGAGTGHYSFYYKKLGMDVTAFEYADANIDKLKEKNDKVSEDNRIHIQQGDAKDLSIFTDGSFDIVLCMGPIYHIGTKKEKAKVIEECKRVLKPDGILAVAYLNRIAQYSKSLAQDYSYIDNREVYSLIDDSSESESIFKFNSPRYMEELLSDCGLKIINNIGTDGISYLLVESINQFTDEQYGKWLINHLKMCQDPYLLGYSLHGLIIGEKDINFRSLV